MEIKDEHLEAIAKAVLSMLDQRHYKDKAVLLAIVDCGEHKVGDTPCDWITNLDAEDTLNLLQELHRLQEKRIEGAGVLG